MGSLSFSDIYGTSGYDDTLPSSQETTQKTNPNNSSVTGQTTPGKSNILNVFKTKNLLGQPLMVWLGLVALLVGIKYFAEKEK